MLLVPPFQPNVMFIRNNNCLKMSQLNFYRNEWFAKWLAPPPVLPFEPTLEVKEYSASFFCNFLKAFMMKNGTLFIVYRLAHLPVNGRTGQVGPPTPSP